MAMPLHFCVIHTVLFLPCYVHRYLRRIFHSYENENEKDFGGARKDENINININENENMKKGDDEKIFQNTRIQLSEMSNKDENDAGGTVPGVTVRTTRLDESVRSKEENHYSKEAMAGTSLSIMLHILSYLFVVCVLQYSCLDHPFLLADNRSGFISFHDSIVIFLFIEFH